MRALFIATPSYDGWVSVEYSSSLLESGVYLARENIGILHGIAPGNPFLDTARNELVAQFLSSEADQLLFIDADVGWEARMLTRVIFHKEEVVGGLVPKRNEAKPDDYHQNALTGVMSPSGLFESKEIPTAFLRIKRSAFEKLDKAYPGEPYFGIGVAPHGHKGDKGEDIWFCREWTSIGESLWIDSDIAFSHRGGKVWRGNFFDHCVKTGALKTREAA